MCYIRQPERAVRLRNYNVPENTMPDCYIWQACRATSAAPTFFPSITIADQKYVDGALGYNNPIRPLLAEAHQLLGGSVLSDAL
jgi:predicted acylesterase/phospholipase RssA